jgi:hypothetical protein
LLIDAGVDGSWSPRTFGGVLDAVTREEAQQLLPGLAGNTATAEGARGLDRRRR